jgi:hypothetical protein
MVTAALMVLAVIIPASAASLLVLVLDLRAHRRRLARRWAPTSSRLTAALGAALGVGGFGLISVAGLAGPGHAARAEEASAQQLWVTAAPPGSGQTVTAPVEGEAALRLPFAPATVWGSGFEGPGSYVVVAEVPGAGDVPLLAGDWRPGTGDGPRALAPLDPGPIVDAARARGIVPSNGAFDLELRSVDTPARLHFSLADRPAAPPAPAPALSFRVPSTAAVAPAARPPVTAAPPAPAAVGVPATGGGAPLLGGLVLVVAGSACAGLSLRLRGGGWRQGEDSRSRC